MAAQQMLKRSIAESLAIAIATSDWSLAGMENAARAIFAKQQPWIPQFLEQFRANHPERPSLSQLVKALSTDRQLRGLIKTRNLKNAKLDRILGRRAIVSLDWDLPRLESPNQLAGHLGLTLRALHWLAALDRPPDRRPKHYVYTWIKKRTSGLRLIESPKATLKSAQRIVLDDIISRIPVHESVHGFRASRNVVSFVSEHVGKPFCLKMDLKDFFPSISARRVFGFFRSAGMQNDVARLLAGICTTQTDSKVVESIRPTGCRGAFEASKLYLPAHLPQGAPSSPALANQLAFQFDRRSSKLANTVGATYTRYADDLLFSGDSRFAKMAKRFSMTVAAIAIEEGFQVHYRKTRFQNSSQRQSATGVVLNKHPNLAREQLDRLKAILHNCVRYGPESQNRDSIANFKLHLAGRICWVAQLNPSRSEKLQSLFEKIDWSCNQKENAEL